VDYGAKVSENKGPQNKPAKEPLPEHLNRCAAVTDKSKSAWQKRNPLQGGCFEVSLS
jgi:hypothetical protein